LVEYKNEGHKAFGQLLAMLNSNIADNILKAGIQVQQKNIPQSHVVESGKKEPGRNDPCPCGAVNPATGKIYKYKNCGLINASHHKR
jgi:uncharacterized protein YecA (UPF0149 family)